MAPVQGQKKGQHRPFRIGLERAGYVEKLDGTPEDERTAKLDAAATAALRAVGIDGQIIAHQVVRAHRRAMVAANGPRPVAASVLRAAKRTAAEIQSLLARLDATDPAITPLLRAQNVVNELAGRSRVVPIPWLASVADAVAARVYHTLDKPNALVDLGWGLQTKAATAARAVILAAYPASAVRDRAVTIGAIRKRLKARRYKA